MNEYKTWNKGERLTADWVNDIQNRVKTLEQLQGLALDQEPSKPTLADAFKVKPLINFNHDPQSTHLTTGQAATVLGMSLAGVQYLCNKGELPSKRNKQGQRLIPRKAVEALAQKRTGE